MSSPLCIQDEGLPVSHKFLGLFLSGVMSVVHMPLSTLVKKQGGAFSIPRSLPVWDDTKQMVKSSSSLKIESKAVWKTYRTQSEKSLFSTIRSIRAGQADLSAAPIHEPWETDSMISNLRIKNNGG